MTSTGYRDSHAMSRWSVISAVTWLVSLSFILPPLVVLLLQPWRALTMAEEFAVMAIASALMLAFSVAARRRARLLDARQRLSDLAVMGTVARMTRPYGWVARDEITSTVPLSAAQWRSLEQIAKS